jgi:hypothetical protein
MASNLIKLTVQEVSSSINNVRFVSRIYLYVGTMREHKLCTGDLVIVRKEFDELEWRNASIEVWKEQNKGSFVYDIYLIINLRWSL